MLLGIPPHGGWPWPRMAVGMAEWCGEDAGRRSARIGSEGGTRTPTHAVGVRARVRLPRTTRIRAEDVSGGNHRR